MRVLIVYPKMELYGGAELLVVRFANYLTEHNIHNALLTTNILPEIERDITKTDIIKYPFRPIKGIFKPMNLIKSILSLHKGVRKNINDFDVINVHNYPAELSICPFRKPVVWMCNEPPKVHVEFDAERKFTARRLVIGAILELEKQIVRRYVRNVVVADHFNAKRFREIYDSRPHIINYGIDYDYFSGYGKTGINNKSPHHFTVLHVGMLTKQKGQMESLKAISKLRDRIPGIKLILAGFGQGQYLSTLKEFITTRNLEELVRFEGHVDRARVRELYHASDVLLHPIGPQGGWLAPFEAIAANLPVVVSKAMTASELIQNKSLGLVTNNFANAVFDIYKNRSKYNEMAAERAEWVRDHLSWDNFGEKMLGVFHKAINEHTHRRASVSMGI